MNWKRLLAVCALLVGTAMAQNLGLSQSWLEFVNLAPPAVVNSQTSSNTTGTGVQVVSTGGAIAAGAYRVCVTLFTATNTETPCSTDTAATSVVTFTGSTSQLIVQSPIASGTGSNVVGYRVYVGANAGAAAAETLQTLNSTVCTLSTSSTPSCALGQPATFTASTGFVGGGGGPATPGTALTPAINNAANQALFENSTQTFRELNWVVTGTAPGSCTVQLQTGSTIGGLANVGQSLTCTATGGYALPSTAPVAFSSAQLSAFTAGDTTTKVTFYIQALPFNPFGSLYFGNAAPTGTCPTGGVFIQTSGAVSTTLYTCNAGAWAAITVP